MISFADFIDRARAIVLSAAKRARRLRTADEFDVSRLQRAMPAPAASSAAYSWDLPAIMSARDAQFAGRFSQAVRVSESMRTDDALYTALENRLAPAQMIGVKIEPARGARGEAIANEAEALFGRDGIALPLAALSSIRLDYVQHGIGIGVLHWTPRADGSRVDVELRHWPLEHVWWDSTAQCYMTRVDTTNGAAVSPYYRDIPIDPYPLDRGGVAGVVPIVHGDGRWIVFAKHSELAHRKQAAILPGCMVWARHAFAGRDWAKGSASHGNAKVVGKLPQGVSLQIKDADGNVSSSPEAAEFLNALVDIASLDAPVGVVPFGSEVEYITNGSRAWEVWERLMANAERSAARIYLGTDGTLGSQGGAPGIDVSALFGVARTRVDGDLTCERIAIATGVIEPWTAINHGDSALAPARTPQIPDDDADAAAASYAARSTAFWADVRAARENGCVVDQAMLEGLGSRYGVDVPRLPEAPAPAPIT